MRPTLTRAASLMTGIALVLSASIASAQDERLTIYTYESFTASWGPGPAVKEAFEAQCECTVDFVAVADGVALLNRLRLEGASSAADIVLGLDTNLMAEARQTGLFAPHGIALDDVDVPGGWSDDIFVPFDYGYFAFVYDTEAIAAPPASLRELVDGDPDDKIVIQDPRTSTPGLGLVLWMKAVYGDEAAAWEKLRARVLTVTPGWSEAYGLFTGGEAPLVLSYTTSPAYHVIAEQSERYKAAAFEEGHYLQVEIAGATAKGAGNPLTAQFLSFMTGPAFQDVIPQTNWMFPAGRTSAPLDPAFDALVEPATTLQFTPQEVAANRRAWVDEWLTVMSR